MKQVLGGTNLPLSLKSIAKWRSLATIVSLVARKRAAGALILGDPGVGKSKVVRDILDAEGVRAEWVSGHLTPAGFYTLLCQHQIEAEGGPEVLVLDDTTLLDHPIAIQLLKGALDIGAGRRVSYHSRGLPDHLPRSISIRVGLLFITNGLPKTTPDFQALLSRVHSVVFKLTTAERLDLVQNALVTSPYSDSSSGDRQAVANALERLTTRGLDWDFRTYFQLLDLWMAFDPETFDAHVRLMVPDVSGDIALLIDLHRRHDVVKDVCAAWMDATGKSRRAFFALKAKSKYLLSLA